MEVHPVDGFSLYGLFRDRLWTRRFVGYTVDEAVPLWRDYVRTMVYRGV